jgi:hypothetical protein
MNLAPLLPPLVGVIVAILIIGLAFQLFRQPQLVAYIIAGVVIGPAGLGIVSDLALVEHLGALGVTLLLFFIAWRSRRINWCVAGPAARRAAHQHLHQRGDSAPVRQQLAAQPVLRGDTVTDR